MRKIRGFPGALVLGCLLIAFALTPALAERQGEEGDFLDASRLKDKIANTPIPGATEAAQTEGGAAVEGRSSNMFLVDGADGGTIYFYNYELRQIIRTCPTPEPADGVSADGLAVANDRGSLWYTNANGTKLIYELDINDCSVIQSLDSAITSGGTSSGSMSTILGMGYGVNNEPARRDGGTGNVVYQAGSGDASTDRIRCFDPDNPGFGWVDSVSLGGGGWEGTVGADPNDPVTLINGDFNADGTKDWVGLIGTTGTVYGQGFGGLTLVLEYNLFTFADYWLPDDQSGIIPDAFPATGQAFLSRRTDPLDPGQRLDREYHTTLGAGFGGLDTIYEYDGSIADYGGAEFLRSPLQSVADPTPGDQVSAIGVDDLDSDFDGIPDVADVCIDVPSADTTDTDLDGVPDACDNCPDDPNLSQDDGDLDGLGDACDLIYNPPPLPSVVVWLTDGFEGGTIYRYDPDGGVILDSFATPELNVGMGQGLGYSQKLGALYYTNGTGPVPTYYKLSPADGAVQTSVLQSDIQGYVVVSLGAGQVGSIDGDPFGGGNTFVYTNTDDRGDGLSQVILNDPDTFEFLTGAGLGGSGLGQGAVAATETNVNEPFKNGIAYFTRNSAAGATGNNRLGALTWDPFGIGGRRLHSVDGPGGAVGIGLGFDGATLYLSKGTVDGLFTYDLFDYYAEFGSGMGLLCDGGDNDGADCLSDAECPNGGACVDASVRAHPTDLAGFISDPTPGGPITGVAAAPADADLDGVRNDDDNCTTIANPGQEDADQDGFGDACDNCPQTANPDQLESELFGKVDGVGDVCDNCFELFNPGQEDDDGDGLGNVCDFAPGFVDDADAFDETFGADDPAPPLATDIALVSTRATICDFSCSGGPDVCCDLGFGNGEEALVVRMEVIGNQSGNALDQGTFEMNLDFCEQEAVGGQLLSICDNATLEPGVGGHQTQDVVITAKFGQAAGTARSGGRTGAGNNFNGLARVENLSVVNQVDGTLEFVLAMSDLAATANPDEQAASGLDQDPLGSVQFGLWWASRGEANRVDRAPDTDDNGNPTILDEISLFTAQFRQLVATPDVDFRGTIPCNNTDQVVVGSTGSSFTNIQNPSFQPMTLTDVIFSDPQFSIPVAFPIVVPELGGSIAVTVNFTPTALGTQNGTGTLVSEDPTPESFNLVGEGQPDDPPVLGACNITPSAVFIGQAPILQLDVSDSATLANISQCTATGVRIAGGTPRTVLLTLVNDGSTPGDVSCDGTYTRTQATGGLFGRGTWEFTFECTDRQGNSSGPLVCPVTLDVL